MEVLAFDPAEQALRFLHTARATAPAPKQLMDAAQATIEAFAAGRPINVVNGSHLRRHSST